MHHMIHLIHIRSAVSSVFACVAATAVLMLPVGCGFGDGWFGSATSVAKASQVVPGARALKVQIRNGAIEVIADPSAVDMSIEATFKCAGANDQEAQLRAETAELVTEQDDAGKVFVSALFPPTKSGATYSQDGVSLVIRVASLDGIELTTSNGRLEIGGLSGDALLRTSNGKITIAGHEGPVDAQSSNGSISAHGVQAPLRLNSSNGAITAVLRPGSEGSVTLETSNGRVELDLPTSWQGLLSANTSNGTLKVDGGARAQDVKIGKRSGSLRLGDGAKASATVKTSNGAVQIRVSE